MKGRQFVPILLTVLAIGLLMVTISIPIHIYFRPRNWNEDKPELGIPLQLNNTVEILRGKVVEGKTILYRWDVDLKYFDKQPKAIEICNNNSTQLEIYVNKGTNPNNSTQNFSQKIIFNSPSVENCTTLESCGGSTFLGFYSPKNLTSKTEKLAVTYFNVKIKSFQMQNGNCRNFQEKFGKSDAVALIIWGIGTVVAFCGCVLSWIFSKRKPKMERTYSKFTTFIQDQERESSSDSDEDPR